MLRIHLQFTDVFQGWQGSLAGIDQRESNYAYANLFVKRLAERFPDADIERTVKPNYFGSLTDTINAPDMETEERVERAIQEVGDDLLENDYEAWIVNERSE